MSADAAILCAASRATRAEFWCSLRDFYLSGSFCDLDFVCGADGEVVRCHKLILSAISPVTIRMAVRSAGEEEGEGKEAAAVVVVPDLNSGQVKGFLDDLYSLLANGCGGDDGDGGDMEKALGEHEVVVELLGVDLRGERQVDPAEALASKVEVEEGRLLNGRLSVVKQEEEEEGESDQDYCPYDDLVDRRKMKRCLDDAEEEEEEEAKVRKRPRLKRECRKRRRFPRKREDQGYADERIRGIERMITEEEAGEVDVSVRELSPGKLAQIVERSPFPVSLLGLKRRLGDGDCATVSARPIVWTSPGRREEDEVFSAYQLYCSVLAEAFGLSQLELHAGDVLNGLGRLNLVTMGERTYGKLSRWSRAELEEMLGGWEHLQACKTGAPKRAPPPERGQLVLTLDPRLRPEDADGVAVLWFDDEGDRSPCLSHLQFDEGDREGSSRQLMEALLCVLSGRERRKVRCEGVLRLRKRFVPLALERRAALELLGEVEQEEAWHEESLPLPSGVKVELEEEEEEEEREGEDRGRSRGGRRQMRDIRKVQCDECGKLVPRYSMYTHRQMHFYQKYSCDCEVTWSTYLGKVYHVQLAHLEGYARCPHDGCEWVYKRGAGDSGPSLERHLERKHRESTCEVCGSKHDGLDGLNLHKAERHPECLVAESKRGERLYRLKCVKALCKDCGKEYPSLEKLRAHAASVHHPRSCRLCGLSGLKGANALRLHVKHEHTSEQACPECGKVLKNPKQLRIHVLNQHTPEGQRPNKCSECDRRFASHGLMDRHRASTHFRDRRNMVCRYAGCGAAYLDAATRCKHEQMKHGQTYAQVSGRVDNCRTGLPSIPCN